MVIALSGPRTTQGASLPGTGVNQAMDVPVLIQDNIGQAWNWMLRERVLHRAFSRLAANNPVAQLIFSERTSDRGANAASPVASGYQRLAGHGIRLSSGEGLRGCRIPGLSEFHRQSTRCPGSVQSEHFLYVLVEPGGTTQPDTRCSAKLTRWRFLGTSDRGFSGE